MKPSMPLNAAPLALPADARVDGIAQIANSSSENDAFPVIKLNTHVPIQIDPIVLANVATISAIFMRVSIGIIPKIIKDVKCMIKPTIILDANAAIKAER
jgi:hypothetical protein